MILQRSVLALSAFILCGCAARADITVSRDKYGVPTIKASRLADVMFGLGYATVQDHAERMARNYKQARGRLAEVEGRSQLLTDGFVRSLGIEDLAQEKAKSLSGELALLIQSFCAGANKAIGELKDRPAWVEPITPVDVLALSQLANAAFPLQEIAGRLMPGAGSNQFAWQGRDKAVLSADPHLPWEGILSWYEIGLECDEFRFRGITLPGLPFGVMGHTDKVAWCMTNNDPDLWDFFQVTTDPNNRARYNYHGEWRDYEDKSYELKYRDGNELKTQPHRVRRTAWGPMVPFSSNAVALSMLGSWEILDESLNMARAKDAKQFREALRPLGMSMWNVVYADTQGNIGYQYNARVPRRDESFDWTKPVPGADPKSKWGSLWTLDELPHVENPRNRLLANANSTPQLTSLGDVIRGTWPKYVLSHGPTTRITRLAALLDSVSSSQPDAGKSRKLATDTEVPRARAVIAAFKAGAGKADSETKEAVAVLGRWDGRADVRSRGTGLFNYWLRVKGMPALAVTAEKDRTWSETDSAAALAGLRQAATEMRKHHSRLDVPWGRMHFSQRGGKTAPVAGFGMYAERVEFVAVSPNTGTFRDGKIVCTVGSSFRMVTDLRPGGIRSWSILPFGNSTNSNSPHYTDQMDLFGRGEYKETRQRAVSKTTLLR